MTQNTPQLPPHEPGQFVPTEQPGVPQHVKKKKAKKQSRKTQGKPR